MIPILLGWVVATMPVVELPDASANEISIQAIVKLPKLGAKDLAKLRILARTMLKQTSDYPRREMLMVTGGEPIRIDITPDVMRIAEYVPADNLKAGLSVMESLLHGATFLQENLDAAVQESSTADYWAQALDPTVLPSVKLGQDEAFTLYHRVLRPERILLAVGGKFVPGQAKDLWESRIDSWNPEREPRGYFDISTLDPLKQLSSPVTTVDLVGAPMLPDDAELTTQALALFALGSGKGASMFRVVREKHAWSYRQEAILEPTLDGWQPHLVFATTPGDDADQKAAVVKADLLADVQAWTDADLARAVGMAESVLLRDVSFSPLYVLGSAPVGGSLGDRTFMAGYWQLKTGQPWDPSALLDAMKHVTLADLKDHATTILNSTRPRILPGS
ncbi:MAG: hypothetical protein P4L46_17060 [Fimbriimonas sp.]|nr:hypothetical protein [Fimbriimonas sp.]